MSVRVQPNYGGKGNNLATIDAPGGTLFGNGFGPPFDGSPIVVQFDNAMDSCLFRVNYSLPGDSFTTDSHGILASAGRIVADFFDAQGQPLGSQRLSDGTGNDLGAAFQGAAQGEMSVSAPIGSVRITVPTNYLADVEYVAGVATGVVDYAALQTRADALNQQQVDIQAAKDKAYALAQQAIADASTVDMVKNMIATYGQGSPEYNDSVAVLPQVVAKANASIAAAIAAGANVAAISVVDYSAPPSLPLTPLVDNHNAAPALFANTSSDLISVSPTFDTPPIVAPPVVITTTSPNGTTTTIAPSIVGLLVGAGVLAFLMSRKRGH